MFSALLLRLAPYKLMVEIAVFGAMLLGVSYGIHEFLEHEREIGRNEVRAEYAKQLAEAKETARLRTAELTDQRDKAIENANSRDQTIRVLAARAGGASDGLRDTLATIRNGVPSATVDALRQSTTALATVLTDCQGRYRALAERADRHASDTLTLQQAWPANPPAPQPATR